MTSSRPNHDAAPPEGEVTSAMKPPTPLEEPGQRGTPVQAEMATLVVQRGPNEGTRYPISATSTVLGRDRACDIVLDDVTVSRQHAEIRHGEGEFTLLDKGSLNGTYLNRGAVDQAKLADGDEVWIGKFRLAFVAG